ncbi:glutamyl-tRNA reductase [Janibacter sp. G56]|uniref:glutamyl-tRNA reductase n=1 Tax=Janibacter sp. G56 TaxID=3418717 RepID=UPI003D030A45
MSLVVLGLSHHAAPIDLLERAALDAQRRGLLADQLRASDHVRESLVVSTCNRTELYADVSTFHGGVDDLTDALIETTGVDREALAEHIFLAYEDGVVSHAFSVAAGLDSMAVGEAQILGQLRTALVEGQDRGDVGGVLNGLIQHALRVGKKVHTETGIDSVSRSLVETGLARAARSVATPEEDQRDLTHRHVLVVGAGGMSSLAAQTALRAGVASLTIVNRTHSRAVTLADRLGVQARPIEELPQALTDADVVISCTGSTGLVVDLTLAGDAQVARGGRPQHYLDLALPHDIAPEVASLRGVERSGLRELGEDLAGVETAPEVEAAHALVTQEVATYLEARAVDRVVPTVTALRARAQSVVNRELDRLDQRTPHLRQEDRDEVKLAVHRIVEKLLHTPTVRVKEMAADGSINHYADAINELFNLTPEDLNSSRLPAPTKDAS